MLETDTTGWMFFSHAERWSLMAAGEMTLVMVKDWPICGPVSSWGSQRSSFGDLARLCPQLYTLVLPGGSSHNTTSYHLPPTQGQPLPPLGHDLVIVRRRLQLLRCKQANWALGLRNALHFSVSRGVIQRKERGPAKWQLAAYNCVHNKRMADRDRPTSTVNPQRYLQTRPSGTGSLE